MPTTQTQIRAVSPNETVNADFPLQVSLQERIRAWIAKRFEFPKGELAIVTTKGEKISLPTPLLGALVALFIWMAGGTMAGVYLAGRMSATVDNLGNTFTQYQIREETEKKALQERYDTELKALREKNELLDLKLADLREKQIRAETRRN